METKTLDVAPLPALDAARLTTAAIAKHFWDPQTGFWKERVEEQVTGPEPAFLWSLAVWMSALAKGLAVDPDTVRPHWDSAVASLDAYHADGPAGGGYSHLPHLEVPERFYDDNQWVVIAYLDAFDATGEPEWLTRAEQLYAYIWSGWDEVLGGGIYWREFQKTEKNVCANGPMLFSAVRLAALKPEGPYADQAKALWTWTNRFRTPEGLYWDHETTEGVLDKTIWTYNVALMIRSGFLLEGLVPGSTRLAAESARSSLAHWYDVSARVLRDEASFAHHLIDVFLEEPCARETPFVESARASVATVWQERNDLGLFGHQWGKAATNDERLLLLYSASGARALWTLAAFESKLGGR